MAPRVTPTNRVKVPLRRNQGKGGVPGVEDGSWWKLASEEKRGQAMWETVQLLNAAHVGRHFEDACFYGLYRNRPPYWTGRQRDPMVSQTIAGSNGARVPLNLVKSVIDTAAAMISKNKAELRAFTSGGSWHDQRKAKQITKYNKGAFYLNQFHRHQQRAFIDACLTTGRGAVQFWADPQAGQVRCGRVHPRTILWNQAEGDDPRNIYRHFPIARETLYRRFPNKAKIIEKCGQSVNPVNPAYRRASTLYQHADMVDLALGWHQGYRDDPDSGRAIARVEGGTLSDDPWPFEFFPFATFCWDDDEEGWGGVPLADTLAGFQTEINNFIRVYRKSLMRAASMAGAWTERTSEARVTGENNLGEPWGEHTYVGKEPVFAAPAALGRDFFEFIMFMYDKAFAEGGFSQLQAQGEKPEGLDAAVALREYNDITATRQVTKGQRYERMTEDAGQIQMALSKQLFTGKKSKAIKVRAPGTKFLEQVDFSDIADVDEDAYVLQQSATSDLPTHFVGRMQAVSEMIRSGLLPEEQVKKGLGLRLLQMPDLEKETDIETSARELTSMQVDQALYEGEWIAPEPYQSPDLLLEVAQNSYLFAKTLKGVPKKNMRLLERLMSEADNIRKKAMATQGYLAPMPPQGPAAAAMTPGPPPGLSPAPGPAQTVINETPAVPLPQPGQLPVPAVPSTVPARA